MYVGVCEECVKERLERVVWGFRAGRGRPLGGDAHWMTECGKINRRPINRLPSVGGSLVVFQSGRGER